MGNGGSFSSSVCMCRSDKLCTLALPPILVFIVTIRLDNVFLLRSNLLKKKDINIGFLIAKNRAMRLLSEHKLTTGT